MVKNQEVEIEGKTVGDTDKPLLKIQNAEGKAVGETDRPSLIIFSAPQE